MILEILMILFVVFLIGRVIINKTLGKIELFIVLIIDGVLLVLHLFFGQIRWQIYPLYMVMMAMPLMVLIKYQRLTMSRLLSRLFFFVVILFVVISASSIYVFPVYQLPKPTGPYLVGTESFTIETDRIEFYADDASINRNFNIQIWYPAETIQGYQKDPWLSDGRDVARGLSIDMGFPIFLLDHTALIMSNSYHLAPISSQSNQYPVIIISHGWSGFRNIHTDFAEELASHGYIVVAIDHTYGSVATIINDEVIYLNRDALPDRDHSDDFLFHANRLVSTYQGDIISTLDYIEIMNDDQSSRFFQKLDLTTIGLVGHSTGGGAAVMASINDSRIKAVIGLDAWVEPIEEGILNQGLNIPSLLLRSETWETGINNDYINQLINNSNLLPMYYQINGTTHFDFAMVYMYSPLTKLIGFSGELNKNYLTDMLRTMILDYFDEYLLNHGRGFHVSSWKEVKMIDE